jgi:hypothetical protein
LLRDIADGVAHLTVTMPFPTYSLLNVEDQSSSSNMYAEEAALNRRLTPKQSA